MFESCQDWNPCIAGETRQRAGFSLWLSTSCSRELERTVCRTQPSAWRMTPTRVCAILRWVTAVGWPFAPHPSVATFMGSDR